MGPLSAETIEHVTACLSIPLILVASEARPRLLQLPCPAHVWDI